MLGSKLEKLRKDKGLTQEELSHRLNLSKSTVSMYESDKRSPDNEMLLRISDFFGVSTDYLLGKEEGPALIDQSYLRVMQEAKERGISPNDMRLALKFIVEAKERDGSFD